MLRFASIEKNTESTKGYGVKSWEILCISILGVVWSLNILTILTQNRWIVQWDQTYEKTIDHWPKTVSPEGFFLAFTAFQKVFSFFLYFNENRCCFYVDVPRWDRWTLTIWRWAGWQLKYDRLEQPNHLALSIWLQDVRDFDIKMMSNKQNWDDGHAKHANVPSCVPLSPLCFPCSCAEWDPSDAERNSCAHRKDQWAKSGEFQIFLGSGRMIWRSDRTDGILTRHQSAWFFLFKVKLMIKRWKKCMKCTKFAFLLCCCFWQVILQLYPIGCAPRNLPDVVCQKLLWPFFEPIPGFKTGSIQATGPTIQPVGWWHSCELTGW